MTFSGNKKYINKEIYIAMYQMAVNAIEDGIQGKRIWSYGGGVTFYI